MNNIKNLKSINSSYLVVNPRPLDAKTVIGNDYLFENISDLITNCPKAALYDGMLVQDTNFAVTWQIYYTGTEFKAKVYDGKFNVKSVSLTAITSLSGAKTISGVSCVAEDIVLLAGENTPHMNGVWVVKTGAWERHEIFSSNTNGINFPGVIFVVTEGTYKNSQWKFTTMGEIVMSDNIADFYTTTLLDFECIDPSKNQIPLETNISTNIGRFNKTVLADATAGDISLVLSSSIFFNEEYFIKKIDNTSNKIIVTKANQKPLYVLNTPQDWVKLSNNINPSLNILSDIRDYNVESYSSKYNITFINDTIVSDSQISNSVPSGYTLYSISMSTNSDTANINLGTTAGASDIGIINVTTTETHVKLDSSDISDIFVSLNYVTNGVDILSDWSDVTISSTMLTYKH